MILAWLHDNARFAGFLAAIVGVGLVCALAAGWLEGR
jgi:hypothetical protein